MALGFPVPGLTEYRARGKGVHKTQTFYVSSHAEVAADSQTLSRSQTPSILALSRLMAAPRLQNDKRFTGGETGGREALSPFLLVAPVWVFLYISNHATHIITSRLDYRLVYISAGFI